MDAKIERGLALVLVGPQGCGKSLLARKLAADAGSFVEIDVDDLESPFTDYLADEPATCIVDGFPRTHHTRERLKAMISSPTAPLDRKGMPRQFRKAPNFIFCTSDADALRLHPNERLFRVVRMGDAARLDSSAAT